MPYLIKRPHIRRTFGALVGATLLAVAIPSVASACTVSSGGSTVFSALGDTLNYVLLDNGSFENGAAGWSLTGASVVDDNDSFHLYGESDGHSLAIGSTGEALSPPVCVDASTPTFRFVTRRVNGTWGHLDVNLIWKDAWGWSHISRAGSVNGGSNWVATPGVRLAEALPLWQSNSTLSVRIQFDPDRYSGTWNIDDIYIDPYSRR